MIKDRYISFFVKAMNGEISPKEKKLLDSWVNNSAANQKEFEQLKSLWNKISNDTEISSPDIDLLWTRLNYRIANYRSYSNTKSKWFELLQRFSKPILKPAFAVLVLMLLLAVYFIRNSDSSVPAITLSTNSTDKKTIALSDGSTVMLNSSSTLTYPKKFLNVRQVNLNGEAFFSVAKGKTPFRVKTDNALVTVLGTKFLIKASDIKTDVMVKEGKVNFKELSSNKNAVILKTGQRSFVVNNLPPSAPENINTDIALGWTKDFLIFKQTSFPSIKAELESTYGIKIVIQKEEINKLTLTGSFETSSQIDSVMEMICLALDLKFNKQYNEYFITKK